MRFRFGKITKNTVLGVFFLLFIFLIAGASLKQTLHVINEIPLGENSLKTFFTNTREKLNGIYSDMLKFSSLSLINKRTYIEMNGLMARLMGQRIMNNVVKLNNGYLTQVQEKIDASYIPGLKQLNELCESRNIEFLYVQAPFGICKYDTQLPVGVSDFKNENIDEFVSLVRDAGIEAIDLHEELHNDGLGHYQAFFRTDHHWTPETGFWATNKIRNYFVNKGILKNEDKVVSDLSNYNIDVYNNIFIGSYTKRTGINFGGGIDDISLIYPKFNTNISVSGNGVDKSGSFKEVFFDMSLMVISFTRNTYFVYPGDSQFHHYNNKEAENKKTVLFASDSFGMVCAPFLSLSVEDMFFGFNAWHNIIDSINAVNPDIVVVLLHGLNIQQAQVIADVFNTPSE